MTTTAYAQLPEEVPASDQASIYEANEETARMAIDIAIRALQELADKKPSITFVEDGSTMFIVQSFNTELGSVTVSAGVPHNLTADNGYIYDGDTITAPNGSRIFP